MKYLKYLPITWSTLYVGLVKNWLSTKELVNIINNYIDDLICNEDTIIEINLKEDDKNAILDILKKLTLNTDYDKSIIIWERAFLKSIEESELTIHQKLKEIELLWSRFDYPESWRNFIYYLPNKDINNELGLYENFLKFLKNEDSLY